MPDTERDIAAVIEAAKQPITDLSGWEQAPADPTAKTAISARVPGWIDDYISQEAVRSRKTPSAVIVELLGDAIVSRLNTADAPPRLIDVAAAHRMLETIARPAA